MTLNSKEDFADDRSLLREEKCKWKSICEDGGRYYVFSRFLVIGLNSDSQQFLACGVMRRNKKISTSSSLSSMNYHPRHIFQNAYPDFGRITLQFAILWSNGISLI